MLGKTLNQRYQLDQLLATGEHGSLFLATNRVSGETLTVRTLPAGSDLRGEAGLRFLRLVRRLEGEEHPNLLSPLETGQFEGTAYQAVAFHPPDTLADTLRQSPLSLAEGLSLLTQVAAALSHLHGLGISHQGVAPYNIFLSKAEGALRVMLGDACHAMLAQGEFPWGGLDAAPFRAPEELPELSAQPDERADLYALGMIGYLVLAGRAPFTGVSVRQVLQRHLIEDAPAPQEFNPDLPHTLSAILLRLVAKSPHERYQSAQGLLADLARWETLPAGSLGRREPPRPRFTAPPIVGRGRARDTILAALTRTVSNRGSLLIISGQDGAGKAHLFESLMPHAVATGALVLKANLPARRWCAPFQLPLALLAELPERWNLLPHTRQEYLRGRLQQAIGACSPILTELQPGLKNLLLPDQEPPPLPRWKLHRRVLHVLAEAFAAVADSRHPLVLWLGDLEFIDPDSLAWLSGLVSRLSHTPIVIAGGISPERAGPGNLTTQWIKRIGPNGAVQQLELPPLARGDTANLARTLLGISGHDTRESVATRLAGWIHDRWGGNPLAHSLVLATLHSRGHIRCDSPVDGHGPGGWRCVWEEVEALELPDTIEGLITARCAAFSGELRQILECAAILPGPFRFRDLTTLVEQLPANLLLERVEEAIEHQILRREGGRLRFSHRLIKTHFYLANSTSRREHLHRLAGAMMETEPSGAPLVHHTAVARHFRLGGDTARAERHAKAAADTALVQQGLAGAAAIYERVISRLEDSEDLPDLLVSLGTAQAMRGDYAQALESLYQACALNLPESLYMEALPLLARSEAARGEHEAALSHVREALTLMESSLPGSPFGTVLGRLAAAARQRYQGLRVSSGAGLAEPLRGRDRKLALLFEQAAVMLAAQDPNRAALLNEKLLQTTAGKQPAPVTVRTLIRLGERQGDPEGQYFSQAGKILNAYAFPHERALLAAARGRCHFNLLDFRSAKDELLLACESNTDLGDPQGAVESLVDLFDLARIQGPCGTVMDLARRMGDLALQLESDREMLLARAMGAYGAGLSGKSHLLKACNILKSLAESALADSDLANSRRCNFLAADLLMGAGRQGEALDTFDALPPRDGEDCGALDFIIDAARAEGHMLKAMEDDEHRGWHQQQAWGLIDGVIAAQKRFPRLAMEVLQLDVMRLLLAGQTARALALVESGEQVLDMQGARISLGKIYMRIAQGLAGEESADWRSWAGKALAQFELTGAHPHAQFARSMLEIDSTGQQPEPAGGDEADLAIQSKAGERPLAVQMLEHMGKALEGGAGATPAMQRTFLRGAMEAINAEYGTILLPDSGSRLVSALQVPDIADKAEINRWLVDQVWRSGKSELMELFHPRRETPAGTSLSPEAQSAICVPLSAGENSYGVIYLGSTAERLRFDAADLIQVQNLARQAGTAVAYGAALEAAAGENLRLRDENKVLRDSADWCPPAAATSDADGILAEFLKRSAAPHGFTGALLYWREREGSQIVLGAMALAENTPEFPEQLRVLDCWGAGRTAVLALQSGQPMWMEKIERVEPDAKNKAENSALSLSAALNISSGLWLPYPLATDPMGVVFLISEKELPRDLDAMGIALEHPLRLICPTLLQLRETARLKGASESLKKRVMLAEAANQRLIRFVPSHLRGAPAETEDTKSIGGERRLSLASGQIYGLGGLSSMGKSATLAELQTCYVKITEALALHQGNLEQIMGDRWIARYSGTVESALWGVMTMIENLADFQAERAAMGLPELSFGIGLHLGDTIGGVLETEQCIEPVLVGEGVQVAARLAEMCRSFRTAVLVSDSTVQALEDVSPFDLRSLGLFRTAPGESRIGVYELYSTRKPEIRQAMRDHQSLWNAAMRQYRLGAWEAGAKLFKSYLGKFPQDRAGRHFLRSCRQRAAQ